MPIMLLLVNWFILIAIATVFGFWLLFATAASKPKGKGLIVVGLILAFVLGYQIHRGFNEVLWMSSDEENAWHLYNPWGIPIKTIEPADLRTVLLGNYSKEIAFNSSSQIILPGDPEIITPYKVETVSWSVLEIQTKGKTWRIKDPPSALSLGYGHTESILFHAGYLLPEHHFTGTYWDAPRMHQTEWLKEVTVGEACWVYSGTSWWRAKIIEISDTKEIKVNYDGWGDPKYSKWIDSKYDEWIAPYRLHPPTQDMPTILPNLDE